MAFVVLDIMNSYCKDCKPFLLLLICQNLRKMGSYLLTIRREDLTIFLLGQLLTKTKEHFVLNDPHQKKKSYKGIKEQECVCDDVSICLVFV